MADYVRAEQLRRLRDEAHLSREKVAAEIGVTTKTLYSWEHGGKIKWENARKVAAFYGVDAEGLVTRDNGDTPETTRGQSQLDRMEASLVAVHDKLNLLLGLGDAEAVRSALRDAEAGVAEASPAASQKKQTPDRRSSRAAGSRQRSA